MWLGRGRWGRRGWGGGRKRVWEGGRKRGRTTSINLPKRPRINLRIHIPPMPPLLPLPRAVLRYIVRRQLHVRKHRVRTHVRLVHHTVRAHALDARPRQQFPRPRPRGDNHVRHAVERAQRPRVAVLVVDAADAAGWGAVDLGDFGAQADVDARFAGEGGDGGGEVEGVDLGGLG